MGNQGAVNHVLHGEPLTAVNDVIRTLRNRLLGIPEVFHDFDEIMNSTLLGRDAYQVAKDFYEDWTDGDDALQAAEKALAKDGIPVAKDLLEMVANWLGLMDRVEQLKSPSVDLTATATPVPTEPQAASPAA